MTTFNTFLSELNLGIRIFEQFEGVGFRAALTINDLPFIKFEARKQGTRWNVLLDANTHNSEVDPNATRAMLADLLTARFG